MLALLGERTAADDEKPAKKKEKPVKVEVGLHQDVEFAFCF